MTTGLRLVLILGLLAALAPGQVAPKPGPLDAKVQALRQTIYGDSQEVIIGVVPPEYRRAHDEKRDRFRKGLEELLAQHGPGGAGARLDCGPVYQALAGPDCELAGQALRDLCDRVLKEDAACWGLVHLIEALEPRLEGPANGIIISGTGPLDLATPEFDEVDPAILAWALRWRGECEEGLAARVLDLYFVRCAAAFGSIEDARKRARELGVAPGLVGRDAAEVKRLADVVVYATEGQATRSTWPDSASERQAFRRFWHGLLAQDLKIVRPEQATSLATLGRAMAAIPGLLARARGEPTTPVLGLKDDEGGRLLADWIDPGAEGKAPWDKRAALLKRASGDERLVLVDLIYDFGLIGPGLDELLAELARGSRDWKLRSMALRALAFQHPQGFDKRIARLGNDKVWQVRLATAEALAAYRSLEAVDALIAMLDDEHLRVRARAAGGLAGLTGVALGSSAKRWKDWMAEKGPDWQLPDEVTARRMREGTRDDTRYARYFDLVVPSNRVAFVLDKSESMYYGLWDGAVKQVSNFLEESGPTSYFGLVEYDDEARVFKKTLLAANAGNNKKAIAFLARSKPTGATNVIDALRAAWEFKDCDSIVLLSDGLPNKGKPSSPQGILDTVARMNRYDRIAIHCVQMLSGRVFAHDAPDEALAEPLTPEESARRDDLRRRAGRDELGGFLRQLALANDGDYGLGFGDLRSPPPGSRFGPGTDR
ncbi:MAG: HEAT repeat domain-containing protein [Planctomycetes bacterium]|nr:HEAT repeat domain-containing protein [Planctomycetota bacterium]